MKSILNCILIIFLSPIFLYGQVDFYSNTEDSITKYFDENNRMLWFMEIEEPEETIYTNRWHDSFLPGSIYRANNPDFKNYYTGKDSILIAIQIGPYGGLWSYKTIICKKINNEYQCVNTTFSHNRFRYKAVVNLNKKQYYNLLNCLEECKNIDKEIKTKYEKDTSELCARFYSHIEKDKRQNGMYGIIIDNENNDFVRILSIITDSKCNIRNKYGEVFERINSQLDKMKFKTTYEL